jgi:hypothetical protein
VKFFPHNYQGSSYLLRIWLRVESTKRWNHGIQDPEEGFKKLGRIYKGRFKPQRQIRQFQRPLKGWNIFDEMHSVTK